jgi:hypothetical protein
MSPSVSGFSMPPDGAWRRPVPETAEKRFQVTRKS